MQKIIRKLFYQFLIFTKADYLVGFLGRRAVMLSLIHRLVPPVSYYSKSDNRKIHLYGVLFIVQMNDLMSQPLFFGLHMDEVLCLKSFFPKNAVVIDVGANIGRWSLLSAKLFQTKKIYSFEPFLETYHRLRKNISLNSSLNIETFNLALNNKSELVTMATASEKNSGMNFISNTKSNSINQVESVTLDFFIQSHDIKKIDLMKIDVEGFEMNVLKGAQQMIQQHHPVIICEINDTLLAKNKTSPKNVFDFLVDHKYQIKKLPNMETVSILQPLENIHFDIIALPDERCFA